MPEYMVHRVSVTAEAEVWGETLPDSVAVVEAAMRQALDRLVSDGKRPDRPVVRMRKIISATAVRA